MERKESIALRLNESENDPLRGRLLGSEYFRWHCSVAILVSEILDLVSPKDFGMT